MIEKQGIIQKDGSVLADDGTTHQLPHRGTDDEGYPEVLIDAKSVGLNGWMHRQSVKPMIGMRCRFVCNEGYNGFNFEIINENSFI